MKKQNQNDFVKEKKNCTQQKIIKTHTLTHFVFGFIFFFFAFICLSYILKQYGFVWVFIDKHVLCLVWHTSTNSKIDLSSLIV